MPVNIVGVGPVAPGILTFPFPGILAPELTPDIVGTQVVIVSRSVWSTAELGRRLKIVPFDPVLFTQDDVPQRSWPRTIVELVQRVAPRIAVAVPMLFPTDLPPVRQAAYRSAAVEQPARPGRGYQDALFQVVVLEASVELLPRRGAARVETASAVPTVRAVVGGENAVAAPFNIPVRQRRAAVQVPVIEQPLRTLLLPIETGLQGTQVIAVNRVIWVTKPVEQRERVVFLPIESTIAVPIVPPICVTPVFSYETAQAVTFTYETPTAVAFEGESVIDRIFVDSCGVPVGPARFDGTYTFDGTITFGGASASGECVTPSFSAEVPVAVGFTDACDDPVP